MIWTKHKVLLGSFCSSLGHLISMTPVLGAVQHSVGPGLQQCCPHIVTGLKTSHPARNRPFLPTWRLRSALSQCQVGHLPWGQPLQHRGGKATRVVAPFPPRPPAPQGCSPYPQL